MSRFVGHGRHEVTPAEELTSVEDHLAAAVRHRHEAGEHKGGQEAEPERQHDEDAGPVRGRLDRHRAVPAQVIGEPGQRAGQRSPAGAGPNGRRDQPVGEQVHGAAAGNAAFGRR